MHLVSRPSDSSVLLSNSSGSMSRLASVSFSAFSINSAKVTRCTAHLGDKTEITPLSKVAKRFGIDLGSV